MTPRPIESRPLDRSANVVANVIVIVIVIVIVNVTVDPTRPAADPRNNLPRARRPSEYDRGPPANDRISPFDPRLARPPVSTGRLLRRHRRELRALFGDRHARRAVPVRPGHRRARVGAHR